MPKVCLITVQLDRSGRRHILLDDASERLLNAFDEKYGDAFVYGCILTEQDRGFRLLGYDDIIHFGGDDENSHSLK